MGFEPELVRQGNVPQSGPFNLVIMILVSMAACAIVGAAIEFFAYRPMRNQSRTAALITAIGVSLFLQYAGQLFLPSTPPQSIYQKVNPFDQTVTLVLSEPTPSLLKQREDQSQKLSNLGAAATDEDRAEFERIQTAVSAQDVTISVTQGKLIMLGTVVVLMAGLTLLVLKTPAGRAMRAASHDFDSASLMGVNVNRVVTFTFMIGSALAGAGAMMLCTFDGIPMQPFFGVQPGVKAFVAAVLGGIGNIPGAVLGGLLMGVAEALVTWLGYSDFKDAVAFVILIIVLLFKPGGLLGSSAVEKV